MGHYELVTMAAFTTFSDAALARYLIMFDIGTLVSAQAIETGIENSNYFLTTSKYDENQEYVLSIMEDLSFDDIPFFNGLLSHLGHYGLPVPMPQQTLDGMTSTIFSGKPTVLFPKLDGEHLTHPSVDHCESIGRVLAEIHNTLATRNFARANPFDADWMSRAMQSVHHMISERQQQLFARVLERYIEADALTIPRGIIHGDLFRDNALFEGAKLTGVIDFYHACDDYLVQDIAITINDWCTYPDGGFDTDRTDHLLAGYEAIRPLEPEERELLGFFQLVAAARFSLTRLLSGEEGSHLKNPVEFLSLMERLSP